jgi:hypothetical protein
LLAAYTFTSTGTSDPTTGTATSLGIVSNYAGIRVDGGTTTGYQSLVFLFELGSATTLAGTGISVKFLMYINPNAFTIAATTEDVWGVYVGAGFF